MDIPYKRLTNADLFLVAGGACKSQHQGDVSIRKECFDQMVEQLKRANTMARKMTMKEHFDRLPPTIQGELEHYKEGDDGNHPTTLGR